MTSPVTSSSLADDSSSIPPPSNGTSPAAPPTPQAPSEADPPGKKAEDLCPDQDPGCVSREQGLKAWAAALAAELPPLTSSQAAAVARIAARLDAKGNVQEPTALRSPHHLARVWPPH
jgi:hypothetical protein